MPPASNMVSPYGQQSHLPPLLTSPPVQMQGAYPSHSFYQAPPNLSTQSFYTAPAVNPVSEQTRYPRPPPRPSNRPILCYRCGEYGQYQSKCALPEGSPPCRHCPEAKDHYSKDCPKQRASTSTASNQGQSDFTFPKINMISVSTIPHAAPSTHVVIPQDTKQTVEEPVGVLTRSQRAALGLKLPKCPPSSSEVQTSTIHKKEMFGHGVFGMYAQIGFILKAFEGFEVSTIPHSAPSTHVVIPQDTKHTVEEPVGVLSRSQRAALGLKLPECPPSSSEVQTSTIHKKNKEIQQDPMISDIDGAFLEAIADLQQLPLPTQESASKGKLSAEFLLNNTFQQVSLYDMLKIDAEFRGDTLAIIQSLYPGASTCGGHLPVQPSETYMISYPTAPLTDYRSPRLTVTILGKQFSGVIVDGGSGINLMPEFTMIALGLQPTRPAPFTVTLADQRTVYPLGIVDKVPLQVQDFTFSLDFVVVRLPQVEGGFPLLIGRPWLRHTKALHDWGNDAMWIHTPDSSMKPIRLEGGMDPVMHHSSLSMESNPKVDHSTPPAGSDEDLLECISQGKFKQAFKAAGTLFAPSSNYSDMKTRQQNIPSEYEESEEAERLDSESSDDSEYAPASQENSSEDNDQAHEDSPSASRGTGATDKISTSEIPRPSNALSDNPIQVVFHLNPPKHALSEVFSPQQQLSQLGLQSLAQVDLLSNMVTPGKLRAMLLTFPKLNNKILNVEHLGRAMGIKNMPIPLPASKTYSRLTPRETADACDELLSVSHPDFQRHQKIFHILHYYFLMRFPVVNSLSLPSPRLYDMFLCLCHSLPYPFHVTMFKAIQNWTKRFKSQRKGKAEKFHCYAAPIMQWMAQLISESDTPGGSQAPATDKGKRPISRRGVQTRGGHSKRTKVSRDSAADLSSLPFPQSHDTRSLRTQTSSHISPTPITTPTGRTSLSHR
ncbi:hypothetical protein L7F22_027302 [Adiantum nelumboides]|nr:hypothetical protein [Adiantum nelumboides]